MSEREIREGEKEENATGIVEQNVVCVHAQLPLIGMFQGSMGSTASSFFMQKESVVASSEVLPNPFVSLETLKACALIGLHLWAAESEVGSSGSQSPDLEDMRRYGCPKSLD